MQAIADSIIKNTKSEEQIIKDIEAEYEKGTDLNSKVKHGSDKSFLLNVAASCIKPHIVHFLLRRKVTVNSRSEENDTPLQAVVWNACKFSEISAFRIVVDLLIAGADVNGGPSKMPPIYSASLRGLLRIVKELLLHKADLHSTSTRGTCLSAASWNGHHEVCKLLLDAGMDVDGNERARDDKVTPLMLACQGGHSKVVDLLLEKGADVKKKDASGNYAIHHASNFGSVECLRLLLACDDSLLNAGNNQHYGPLEIAIRYRRYDCVEYLLDHGAKAYGNTTWPLVSSMNDLSLIKLIALHPNMYMLTSRDLAELVSGDFIDGAEFILTGAENVHFEEDDLKKLIEMAKSEEMKQLLRNRIKSQDEHGKLLSKVKVEVKEEEEEEEKAGTRRTRSSSSSTKPKPKNSADSTSKKKPAPKTTKKKTKK